MTAKDELHTQGEAYTDRAGYLWIGDPYGNGPFMFAQIRGWGHLTGTGACRFPDDKAAAIQEANAERLARAWNSLSPNEARIAELEQALREVESGLLENIEEAGGSGAPDPQPPEPATERDVALVNLLGIVRAVLEPAKARK